MKELRLQFTDEEAARIERVAKASQAKSLSAFARRAVLDRVIEQEPPVNGHYPKRPHPRGYRGQDADR